MKHLPLSGLVGVGLLAAWLPIAAQTLFTPGGNIGTSTTGNVGIGTSSPNALLDVGGRIRLDYDSASYGISILAYPSGGWTRGFNFRDSGGGELVGFGAYGIGDALSYGFIGSGPLSYEAPWMAFRPDGKVGIGTTTPGQRFHVWGENGLPHSSGLSEDGIARFGNSQTNLVLDLGLSGAGSATTWLQSRSQTNYSENYNLALNPNGGNVGIGTAAPNQALSINGNLSLGGVGSFIMMGLSAYTGGGGYIFLKSMGDAGRDFAIQNYSTATGWNTNVFTAGETGNVGIGTTTPTHKLAVNGTIRAKEIIVDTGWADYVFADDYELMPLEEVAAHIHERKHLPGIPSAEEVAEQGVSLGEMQSLLLAKIEELTLHVIEQEKRHDAQDAEIRRLRADLTSRDSQP